MNVVGWANCQMGCLHYCHSSSFLLPLHYSQLKHNSKLKTKQQPWLFLGTEALVLQRQNHGHLRRTNAFISSNNNPLFLIAAKTKIPPSQSGDITVFLQTSALLLVVYFLGNFVAPYFISKYFEFDKVDDDQKTNENDP